MTAFVPTATTRKPKSGQSFRGMVAVAAGEKQYDWQRTAEILDDIPGANSLNFEELPSFDELPGTDGTIAAPPPLNSMEARVKVRQIELPEIGDPDILPPE